MDSKTKEVQVEDVKTKAKTPGPVKAAMLNKKRRKTMKKIKRMVSANKSAIPKIQVMPNPPSISTSQIEDDPFQPSMVLWDEGKSLLLVINGLLDQFSSIVSSGVVALTNLDINSKEHKTLRGNIDVLSVDLKSFYGKWKMIAESFKGKSDRVSEADLPFYYEQYDEMVTLQADINVVLVESAGDITEQILALSIKG